MIVFTGDEANESGDLALLCYDVAMEEKALEALETDLTALVKKFLSKDDNKRPFCKRCGLKFTTSHRPKLHLYHLAGTAEKKSTAKPPVCSVPEPSLKAALQELIKRKDLLEERKRRVDAPLRGTRISARVACDRLFNVDTSLAHKMATVEFLTENHLPPYILESASFKRLWTEINAAPSNAKPLTRNELSE